MNGKARSVVLIAVDDNPESLRALPIGRAVAAQLYASPTVLFVAPDEEAGRGAQAAAASDRLRDTGVPVRLEVGPPAEVILREIASPEVVLLVMTMASSSEDNRPLGAVALKVLTSTDRPILAIRPEVGHDVDGTAPPIRRLLVPVDGSAVTASALQPVVPLARQMGASIDVLYIAGSGAGAARSERGIAPSRYVDQPQHEWELWAEETKQRLLIECAGCSPSADIGVHLRQGDPGREIVRFAREGSYDAIVLVRRSKLEANRGKALRTAIRDAPCSLLFVGGAA